VPLPQFEQDQSEFDEGIEPTDLTQEREACAG
jgi:hypothetical protein